MNISMHETVTASYLILQKQFKEETQNVKTCFSHSVPEQLIWCVCKCKRVPVEACRSLIHNTLDLHIQATSRLM